MDDAAEKDGRAGYIRETSLHPFRIIMYLEDAFLALDALKAYCRNAEKALVLEVDATGLSLH